MTEQPIWQPDFERIKQANITRFLRILRSEYDPHIQDYASLYQFSIDHPKTFWRAIWEFGGVIGERGSDQIAEQLDQMPGTRWFPEARLNFAENLLRFRDEKTAIAFRGERGEIRRISYAELHRAVAKTTAGLRAAGIQPRDRVAGFMPNLPETVIAMLAATSLGAIWSSCSPDFGTNGVVDRLGQIQPKVLFAAAAYSYNGKTFDCLERISAIQQRLPSLEQTVVIPYVADNPDLSLLSQACGWDDFGDAHADTIPFAQLPFDHPIYILYSSGTTGVPKCITHGAGGVLLQHLKELILHTDLKRDDSIFYFTTCGWMMWNWLVSSLAVGATMVLFDGSPFHPGPETMFDMIDEFDIDIFGTSAKAVSAWEKAGIKPAQTHRLKNLRTLLSTGSPLAPESFEYVYRDIKQDICLSSISGGTDIVSCFALGCPTLPVYIGELQCRGLGMKVEILDEDGQALTEQTGELCCTAPFPSMPVCFWGDEDGSKYRNAYFKKFPNIWAHGDYAKLTERGGIVIFGRSDATLNPGGVRIGTAEIYRQVEKLDEVLESICIGQEWDDDVRVVLFVKLRNDVSLDDDLIGRIKATIRSNTTPRHVPAKVVQVADIPRTLSGKIVELAVRNVVHHKAVKNMDALANPEALELFKDLPELQD